MHTLQEYATVCKPVGVSIEGLYTGGVSTDESQSKLHALVGAALIRLVHSGADKVTVGSFAVEHIEEVAQILGMTVATTAPPDLQAIIKAAVAEGVEMAKGRRTKSGGQNAAAPSRRIYISVGGVRTSVSIPVDLFESAAKAAGGSKGARQLVQHYANQAPDESNRSGWTGEQLKAHLAMITEAGPADAPRH